MLNQNEMAFKIVEVLTQNRVDAGKMTSQNIEGQHD